jgi:hypothetical protein
MGKLALISSEYGKLFLFLKDGDNEELAHGLYRYIIEDLYDNEEARASSDFGNGILGYEEDEASWGSEREAGEAES